MDRIGIGILHPQSTSSFNHAILQLALVSIQVFVFFKRKHADCNPSFYNRH